MLSLMFLLGVMFIMSMQPVFMVSMLIVITFVYSYMIYKVVGTFWFSYVLLMVMLSGVLVVFTYMVTLCPNESFEVYSLVVMFLFMVLFVVGIFFMYELDFSIITVNLWISYLGMMSLFLVGFLFCIMLLVVSLSYVNDGALRIK
uniref:NADH dehydrogenase subunit 6 n=1 Tax=Phoneutria boliviensis TaxID=2598454 RepID=UPI001D10A8FB|nr:NADH dehydrogenase subunit 6 [Phoneutria boliviensis]UBY46229.1 NADH dehydrogenase subunit 6 [Phoneutria boliviensis]